jgi:hypothetical protein
MSSEPKNHLHIVFVKFAEGANKVWMYQCGHSVKAGQRVLCEMKCKGEEQGIVVDNGYYELDYETDKEEVRKLLAVSGQTLPLRKITGIINDTAYGDEGTAWTMEALEENEDD